MWRKMLCLMAALACCAWGCTALGAEDVPELLEPVGVQMDTAQAYRGDIRTIELYEGAVCPQVEELYFTVPGTVGTVHVAVGQAVKKGDILIALNQENEEKKLKSLQETLERLLTQARFDDEMAALELEILISKKNQMRFQGAEEKTLALMDLDIEEEQLNQALEKELRDRQITQYQENIEKLQEEMKAGVLYAPFDGRILFAASLQPGSSVKAYHPILYLADESKLMIESDYVSPVSLQNAFGLYAMIEDQKHDLVPVEIDMKEYVSLVLAGEEVKSQFSLRDENAPLKAGQYAMVCIVTREAENALLIPSNALYSDSTGKYVYLIENGKRVRRSVKVGITTDWETQITEGLEEGAVVYVKE